MKNVLASALGVIMISLLIFSCKNENKISESNEFIATKQRIDSAARKFMNESNVVGASIAILSRTDTIYNRTFGYLDTDKKIPATTDHRFIMASISKLIGSVVVMKMVEEGKLNLDQTLGELIPDLHLSAPGPDITLRQMISHTSGLPEYSEVIDTAFLKTGMEPTRADINKFLEGQALQFEPGRHFSYCNSGFRLMADIVERISGNSYQFEIDRVINTPGELNLKLIRETATDPLMAPYFQIERGNTVPSEHWTWIKGDGGLTATSLDLAHFPHKWSDGTLISKESFEEMITPVLLRDSTATGYGIGVRNGELAGHRMIGHTGGHNTPLSVMAYFPDVDLSIVTFVNTDKTQNHVRKLFAAVVHAYFDQPTPNYKANSLKPDSVDKLVGDYVAGNGEEISIKYESSEDALYYCLSQDDCERIYRIKDNRYWLERWPYDFIEFSYDSNSSVSALKEYYYGYFFSLRKKRK